MDTADYSSRMTTVVTAEKTPDIVIVLGNNKGNGKTSNQHSDKDNKSNLIAEELRKQYGK